MKKSARRRIDVNLDELDRVLDSARQAPLNDADYEKIKEALHAMAALLVQPRSTEKTSAVLEQEDSGKAATQQDVNASRPAGHGRNPAKAFAGAQRVDIPHQNLKHGDRCPECGKGNVYEQKEPKVLVRIVGQAPLAATVYSLERLRCGACGQVFTAQEPEGVGPEKYDETATAMIAQLKYGTDKDYWWPSRTGLNKRTVEIEAEAVAFIVTTHAGLTGSSAAYVSRYLPEEKMPSSVSLNLIAKVAGRIEEMGRRTMEPRRQRRTEGRGEEG